MLDTHRSLHFQHVQVCLGHQVNHTSVQVQASAHNLVNDLKQAVRQIVSGHLEAEGIPDPALEQRAAKLAGHLLRRCLHILLASSAVYGSGKVDALKELLQRGKIWAAGFGTAAHVAISALLKADGQNGTPSICESSSVFKGLSYEMWHMARCAVTLKCSWCRSWHCRSKATMQVLRPPVARGLASAHAAAAVFSNSTAVRLIEPRLFTSDVPIQAVTHTYRHFKVALNSDKQVKFSTDLMTCLDSFMESIQLEHVWRHGALWEALAMEAASAKRSSLSNAEPSGQLVTDESFQRAISIVMPIKVFFRALAQSCGDWVRLKHCARSPHLRTLMSRPPTLLLYAEQIGS